MIALDCYLYMDHIIWFTNLLVSCILLPPDGVQYLTTHLRLITNFSYIKLEYWTGVQCMFTTLVNYQVPPISPYTLWLIFSYMLLNNTSYYNCTYCDRLRIICDVILILHWSHYMDFKADSSRWISVGEISNVTGSAKSQHTVIA